MAPNLNYVSVILQFLGEECNVKEEISRNINTLPQDCLMSFLPLTQLEFSKYWDYFLIRTAFISSITVFSTKFALLLKYSYNSGAVVIGYTVAYQNMLIFATTCILPMLKEEFGFSCSKKRLLEHCLLICGVCLIGIYYAPSHECYLAIFIPMIITRTLVIDLWDEAMGLSLNKTLKDASDVFTKMLTVFVSILFGYLAEYCGVYAFKLFCILPPAACLYIINQRFISSKYVVLNGVTDENTEVNEEDGQMNDSKED